MFEERVLLVEEERYIPDAVPPAPPDPRCPPVPPGLPSNPEIVLP